MSDPARPIPARRRRSGSPGVSHPTTLSSPADPAIPGGSSPRHLPPSRFAYLPDGFRPAGPGGGTSATAASMGFSLQGLAPPGRRHPSRGPASPVVSPRNLGSAASTTEVCSGWEGGWGAPRPKAGPQTLPSWGFAPPRLSPPSPLRRLPAMSPSCPSTGSAPYGPHPGGASGVCLRWKRRCLSRGCQPSWGFAPFRCRSAMRTSDVPGLMVSPRPKGSSPEGSLWEVVRPTGVRGTDRLGASVTPEIGRAHV